MDGKNNKKIIGMHLYIHVYIYISLLTLLSSEVRTLPLLLKHTIPLPVKR